MDLLDVFALIVLCVLVLSVVGGALVLGALPGKIAAQRGHPQAAAINVCGWLGLLTLGILWPIAFIWAYMQTPRVSVLAEAARDPNVAK